MATSRYKKLTRGKVGKMREYARATIVKGGESRSSNMINSGLYGHLKYSSKKLIRPYLCCGKGKVRLFLPINVEREGESRRSIQQILWHSWLTRLPYSLKSLFTAD